MSFTNNLLTTLAIASLATSCSRNTSNPSPESWSEHVKEKQQNSLSRLHEVRDAYLNPNLVLADSDKDTYIRGQVQSFLYNFFEMSNTDKEFDNLVGYIEKGVKGTDADFKLTLSILEKSMSTPAR